MLHWSVKKRRWLRTHTRAYGVGWDIKACVVVYFARTFRHFSTPQQLSRIESLLEHLVFLLRATDGDGTKYSNYCCCNNGVTVQLVVGLVRVATFF
jgi:hypothetical protein